jgi:hypothetical protein
MSPRCADKFDAAETSRLIRREIRTEANARFLRRMPMFRTDQDLPNDMRDMLARLDHAEGSRSR